MKQTANNDSPDTLPTLNPLSDFADIRENEYLYNYEPSSVPPVQEDKEIYFPGKGIYNNDTLFTYPGHFLPHWEIEATVYHACFRLSDSVPVAKQKLWQKERNQLKEKYEKEHQALTEAEMHRLQKLYSETIERYLDAGYGSCILRNPEAAQIVKDSLLYYNEIKYILHAWYIMPNHVHVIFQMLNELSQSEILQGWKSFTAHAINKLLNRKGQLWQNDTYNHIIRTADEYNWQIRYVWNNPLKAGFPSWQWRWKCLDDIDDGDVCSR